MFSCVKVFVVIPPTGCGGIYFVYTSMVPQGVSTVSTFLVALIRSFRVGVIDVAGGEFVDGVFHWSVLCVVYIRKFQKKYF